MFLCFSVRKQTSTLSHTWSSICLRGCTTPTADASKTFTCWWRGSGTLPGRVPTTTTQSTITYEWTWTVSCFEANVDISKNTHLLCQMDTVWISTWEVHWAPFSVKCQLICQFDPSQAKRGSLLFNSAGHLIFLQWQQIACKVLVTTVLQIQPFYSCLTTVCVGLCFSVTWVEP